MKRTLTLFLSLAGLGAWSAVAPLQAAEKFGQVPPPSDPFAAPATNAEPAAVEPVLTPAPAPAPEVKPITPAPDAPAIADMAANVSLSATSSKKRARWQQRLTLGPGDVLDISLLDQTDSLRTGIVIGPDGYLNYREVQNMMVTGLTVDELRSKLDGVLGKFYQSPRSIVIPVSYHSKKYFVLGAVQAKGVYMLDRPTSIIEAVARAGGLESGVLDRSPTELADLAHSFLVRGGERVPVDFEKLFLGGDLSQNIPVEPEDYLFFAPASLNEVYVLGAVGAPGPQPWERTSTVISAITRHGSFMPNAYRQRVLVVRGSLNNPQTFVVDTAAILSAKSPDFKLEPHDIVFVHTKPWTFASELLQGAATSFVQAALVTYTGNSIGPIIRHPFLR